MARLPAAMTCRESDVEGATLATTLDPAQCYLVDLEWEGDSMERDIGA